MVAGSCLGPFRWQGVFFRQAVVKLCGQCAGNYSPENLKRSQKARSTKMKDGLHFACQQLGVSLPRTQGARTMKLTLNILDLSRPKALTGPSKFLSGTQEWVSGRQPSHRSASSLQRDRRPWDQAWVPQQGNICREDEACMWLCCGGSLVGSNLGQNPRIPSPTIHVPLSKKRVSLQFFTLLEAREGHGS